MIKGIGYRNDVVHITHLQFADDTMLFLKPRVDYILNAKRILRCFELASGSKLTFIECLNNEVWSRAFRCASSSLPITYLGLPLGENSRRERLWNPVLQKLKERLAPWKRGYLSKG
ncbi:hypothetical protein Ddye_016363 [Dipteronia dyeriana]|uniref:Reverse transcriptase domain-containing protein n=1 Tax=Dipteronia dyeriana TaxID=168575 RepID=A0AAD9U7J3_9ROSI|nr:hypothetical protein Ddye_016363 [Dipteronia dyeriana]